MKTAILAFALAINTAAAAEMPPAPPDAAINAADNLKLACIRMAMESAAMPDAPHMSGPNGIYCLERVESFVRRQCPGKLEREQAVMDVQRGALEDATIGRWTSTDEMLGFMLAKCLGDA